MNDLSKRIKTEKFLIISSDELQGLLQNSQIVFEQDTRIRDYIRILRDEDNFILQETTNLGEIMIRRFETEADAMKLVKERMEIYDKMWDGCGCKINYYE